MNLTRRFVETLVGWPADDAALQDRCKLLVLDGLAVAVAGAVEPGPAMVAEMGRAENLTGLATVIVQGFRTAPHVAARINGMAMHVLDFEPMWNPPNHAISPLLPALLALAEQLEALGDQPQGRSLLRALAIGIEAQGRLRLSSGQFQPSQLSLHPPGVVGPLATAIACSALLNLDPKETVMSLGIAASRTGGLLANVGSHTKALHCGDAASNGLQAALMAKQGFTANDDALDGARGWGRSFFGSRFDPEALLAPIGRGRALDPGPSWKLFPSQFATHFGITAALDVRSRLQSSEVHEIDRVELRVPSMPYIDRPMPCTGLEGKFSWQYTAALALLDGKVDLSTFSEARRRSGDVDALLRRFVLVPDSDIPGEFDAMHVVLTVYLKSGAVLSARCDSPLGSWLRPVGPESIREKASHLLADSKGQPRMRAIQDVLAQPVDRVAVRDLMAFLL